MGISNIIYKKAERNIINKLEKQGIYYLNLSDSEFNSLVEDEARKLKKVGLGFAVGLAINLIGF